MKRDYLIINLSVRDKDKLRVDLNLPGMLSDATERALLITDSYLWRPYANCLDAT